MTNSPNLVPVLQVDPQYASDSFWHCFKYSSLKFCSQKILWTILKIYQSPLKEMTIRSHLIKIRCEYMAIRRNYNNYTDILFIEKIWQIYPLHSLDQWSALGFITLQYVQKPFESFFYQRCANIVQQRTRWQKNKTHTHNYTVVSIALHLSFSVYLCDKIEK